MGNHMSERVVADNGILLQSGDDNNAVILVLSQKLCQKETKKSSSSTLRVQPHQSMLIANPK